MAVPVKGMVHTTDTDCLVNKASEFVQHMQATTTVTQLASKSG